MSLRFRLFALAAFALLALLIAILSAYRTARMSAFFAERQAAESVNSAVGELRREALDFPDGRTANDFGNAKKTPPHIREAFDKYRDPLTRSAAIALHAPDEVSGGFCASAGETKGAIFNQNFSAEEMPFVQNICRQTDDSGTRRYEFTNSTLFAAFTALDNNSNDEIKGAFAVKSVAKMNFFADRFNFLTQAFLLLTAVGLVIFSFLTLRDWRGGMRKIEAGMREIPNDLSSRIDAPQISELEKISREINRLAENLETNLARRKELEKDLARNEKLAALGRLASGAAHEIRNPLAAMKLKIQLAERNDFDKVKLGKTFAVLNEEINRLDNLVTKMLAAGKREKLNFSILDSNEILRGRIELTAEKAAAQNVKIETDFAAENDKIKADGEKLKQVFDNLLLNALEAMSGGGVLKITSSRARNKIIYQFSDTGAGLSGAERERLFEPFYTTKDKGTGLGLAISREITEAHGGKIYPLDSTEGATFVIELPLGGDG